MPRMRAVSLFTNCGAGDIGYHKAGFDFDVMAELDSRRLEVALLNHPGAVGVPGDLRETWQGVVEKYNSGANGEELSLLAACPPCQGMSSARSGRGLGEDADAGSRDTRNLLVVVIAEVARQLNPRIIVVENVPTFLTRKVRHPDTHEPVSAASLLVSLLHRDYEVFPIVADLCDFGVPQTRKRSFLTFVRKDIVGLQQLFRENRAPYPRPSHSLRDGGVPPVDLRSALRMFQLPSLDARSKESARADLGNGLHHVPVWDDRIYSMVAHIPPHVGASAWENDECRQCGALSMDKEAATCELCAAPLPRPVVREEDGSYRLVKGFRSSSYRRMASDKPASTVTTASGHVGSDCTIHPFENRLLSPLECARLQTFPDDFEWGEALKKWGASNVREMIGEAVPPKFTHLHGLSVMGVLTGQWACATISMSDQRCLSAVKKLNLVGRLVHGTQQELSPS